MIRLSDHVGNIGQQREKKKKKKLHNVANFEGESDVRTSRL